MAAYAKACAKAGSPINWMSNQAIRTACSMSDFGVCLSGQTFQDCSKNPYKTCKDLSLISQDRIFGVDCHQGKIILQKKYFYGHKQNA